MQPPGFYAAKSKHQGDLALAGRQQKEREILEVYLLHLILAYRPLLRILGTLLLIYALVVIVISPAAGIPVFGVATLLFLLTFSYQVTLLFAKIGAWAGTFWK